MTGLITYAIVFLSLGILVAAGLHDAALRTIPNWMPACLAAGGLVLRAHDGNAIAALSIAALLLIILGVLWLRGFIGGGDMKLIPAVAIVLPPSGAPAFILSVALAGGVLALLYLALPFFVPPARARARGAASSLACSRRRHGACTGTDLCLTPSPSPAARCRSSSKLFPGRSPCSFASWPCCSVSSASAASASLSCLAQKPAPEPPVAVRRPRRRHRAPQAAHSGRRPRLARRQPFVMEDIGATEVPIGQEPPGSYADTIGARSSLRGAMVRRSLAPNEPIVAGDVLNPGDRGFLAAVLGTGMRAVTVGVDPVSGTAGLIWPGDHVDVVLTQSIEEKEQPLDRRVSGETVLTNVRVIAVDQQLVQGGQGAQANPTTVANANRTITWKQRPTMRSVLPWHRVSAGSPWWSAPRRMTWRRTAPKSRIPRRFRRPLRPPSPGVATCRLRCATTRAARLQQSV